MWIAILSVTGVVLGAWYMLFLVQRVFYGPLHEPHDTHGHDHDHGSAKGHDHGHSHDHHASAHADGHHDAHGHDHHAEPPLPPGPKDMNGREFCALAPLVVFMLWIGLVPGHFMPPLSESWKLAEPAAKVLDQRAEPAGIPLSGNVSEKP